MRNMNVLGPLVLLFGLLSCEKTPTPADAEPVFEVAEAIAADQPGLISFGLKDSPREIEPANKTEATSGTSGRDKPTDLSQFKSIMVTVRAISLQMENNSNEDADEDSDGSSEEYQIEIENWIEIGLADSKTIDLLSLEGGLQESLTELIELDPGTYTQIRLILDEDFPPYVTDQDESQEVLEVPGGENNGLKVVRPFTIVGGEITILTIDLDVKNSILKTGGPNGGFKLKPTLKLIVENDSNESSKGVVSDEENGEKIATQQEDDTL